MKPFSKLFFRGFCAALMLMFVFLSPLYPQSFFRINWEKTIDIGLKDKILSVSRTTDGNLILAGESISPNVQGQKILLVKINSQGELIWQKTLGGTSECTFRSISTAASGGYYILGSKHQGTANAMIWIVKTDTEGNLIWETTTGGGAKEIINDLYETAENGVFLCGAKEIKGNNDTDGWLIKLNKKGAIESQAMFGARYINDEFLSMIPEGTGGFILAGYTSGKLGGEKIPYLLRLDARGYKIWEQSYPTFTGAIPASLFINTDGLIACLMNVYSASGEFMHISSMLTDHSGSLLESYESPLRLNISKNAYTVNGKNQMVLLSVQDEDPSVSSQRYIGKLGADLKPIWIKPLEMEQVSMQSVLRIDAANYLTAGWTGQNNYKLDIRAFSFRDYSAQLIETYVNQNLVANAGMGVNEAPGDFKTRIGSQKYDGYMSRFETEAIKNLRLVPEAWTATAEGAAATRPPAIASTGASRGSGSGDVKLEGSYHALLIAVEDYHDPLINDLDKPINDAQKLFDVLINEYLFEKANVTFLKNPTREQIISTLDQLEKELTHADNLLIFYAGHGYWNETSQKGFWLPADASKQNTANWIGNSSVSDYIRSIPAKHTLLIADACFSGSIFKTRAAFGNQDLSAMRLYELTSRKAMTSGTLTEVPDKSVFIDFLVKRLYENEENFLPSEQLFFSFKPAVLNNTESVPQYGVVGNAGDEGGDFIFVRRKK
jgi:hypothetical protein